MFSQRFKRLSLEDTLQKGLTSVIVDASRPEVKVPESFLGKRDLMLLLSWKFGAPMEITDQGVTADLIFQGVTFTVVLPWDAIWYLKSETTGTTMVFADSVPADLGLQPPAKVKLQPIESVSDDELLLSPPRRGHLKLVN